MQLFEIMGLCPIRLVADLSLAASIPVLGYKIFKTGHEGVSLATQLLLVYVFGARYADLFFNGIHFSAYNDVFKYFYFFGSFILYCAVAVKHTRTKCDNNVCDRRGAPRTAFRLSIPCFALAYVFNYRSEFLDFGGNIHWYTPTDWLEVAWAFSIYLAIFAAVPQLRAFRRSEKKDPLILAYLVLLFMSRALYLPHWYLRYQGEGMFDPIAVASAVVQSMIFVAYIPVCIRDTCRKRRMGAISLPEDTTSGDIKEKVVEGVEAV